MSLEIVYKEWSSLEKAPPAILGITSMGGVGGGAQDVGVIKSL